jgi:hypothetical protein
VKVKILTGNYTLQANRQKYNQHEASPICKLCNLKPEDREHFIRRCPILETKRKFYLHQLFELLREHSIEQLLNTVREEQEKLMLHIMDCTNYIFNLDVKKELDLISEIEEITRNLTFDLHNCRAVANPTFFLFEEITDFNAATTTTTCD